jgi:Ni,Fe-hydrogenase III large subunit/Ni,Fe-hydrogenase III component G
MTTHNSHSEQYIPKTVNAKFFDNVAVFEVAAADIKEIANDLRHQKNLPLKLITATDERATQGGFKIFYVFGVPGQNNFVVPFITLSDTEEFPSLTSVIHEAWNYERKIHTFFGLTPVGHPDLRPIILHENWPVDVFPLRKDFDGHTRPAYAHGEYRFQTVKGEGIYEIPVGPVHAGIIEPGHFRLSVAGEEIMLLEPRLGFVHKGSEKLFEQLPLDEQIRLSEKISGDSSFSHSLAFCGAVETLSGCVLPPRAHYLRTIFAELERLANHFGDIGAIMLDTGFNFGGANGARLREIVLRINERIAGSRFLRGVNTVGGVTKDISAAEKKIVAQDLVRIEKDFSEVVDIAENSISLLNRLQGTGVLTPRVAKDHAVVGVAARAVGIQNDTRVDFPYAAYGEILLEQIPIETDGDVCARFRVRIKEVCASIDIIQRALSALPDGPIVAAGVAAGAKISTVGLKENAFAISVIEGWRGEILYFITTDAHGNVSRVAVRDPSFLNWIVVGNVGFGNIVPDFPLINKSFNLSYSGNDL